MKKFEIRLSSVQDVQAFVAQSTIRPFPVQVQDSHRQVNGKSFMEMFCLNFSQPLAVEVDCTEEEFNAFCADIRRFEVSHK